MAAPWGFFVLIAFWLPWKAAISQDTGLAPESPEVQAIIQKGAEFLRRAVLNGLPPEAPPPSAPGGAQGLPGNPMSTYGGDSSWGPEMLAALVCFHATGSENDPAVAKVVAKSIGKIDGKQLMFHGDGAIDIPISIIFLSEVNLDRHRSQVQAAMQFLLDNQLSNGAWNRLSTTTESLGEDGKIRNSVSDAPNAVQNDLADLEATQFVVYSLWYAKQAGIPYPQESLIKATRWLLRTKNQQPNVGRWAPSTALGGVKNKGDVRNSRDMARVSALIACADALGLKLTDSRVGDELPTAFRLAPKGDDASSTSLVGLQAEIRTAISTFEREFTPKLPFNDALQRAYALYSFERMHAFRDHNLNRSLMRKVPWYGTIVKTAKDSQSGDGSFGSGAARFSDTALMCLALQRGLRFRPANEGLLNGGRGLPGDSSAVSIRGNRVISLHLDEIKKAIADIFSADDDRIWDLLEGSESPLLSNDQAVAAQQMAAVRRALTADDYLQRRKAIRVLAREHNLDNAPLLIYALSDPDREVVIFAEEGLRRISRRLDSPSIRENASDEERARVIEGWKKWYRNLRPDAIFIHGA